MKRIFALALALTVVCALGACGNRIQTQDISRNEAPEQSEPPRSEAPELTEPPRSELPDNDTPEREVLELEDLSRQPIAFDFEEGDLPEIKSISLPLAALDERSDSIYDNEKELDALVQYIKDTLNADINSSWKVTVHYYDADKTVGMVRFLYTVGEIDTNRSIVFNINEGKCDTMYCKCLTGKIDEAELLDRAAGFKSRYVQGKRALQDGETFCGEQTNYTYYIDADKLVYSYAYFFRYDIGVINNDWGTVRIIDENGAAIPVG